MLVFMKIACKNQCYCFFSALGRAEIMLTPGCLGSYEVIAKQKAKTLVVWCCVLWKENKILNWFCSHSLTFNAIYRLHPSYHTDRRGTNMHGTIFSLSLRLHTISQLLAFKMPTECILYTNEHLALFVCYSLSMRVCISYNESQLSVHEAPFRFRFSVLFRSKIQSDCEFVCMENHAALNTVSLSIHTIHIECIWLTLLLLVLPLFGLTVDCVFERRALAAADAVAVGWLLCLWYAKCDIFSHLLALRLFECVGVFGTSFYDIFRYKFFYLKIHNISDGLKKNAKSMTV